MIKILRKLSVRDYIFTIFCLIAFITIIFLGVWQVKRLSWKEQLIDRIHINTSLPPLSLPFNGIPEEDTEFRYIDVSGHYMHAQEIFVGSKYYKNEPGFYLITPLLMSDNTVILINRGWVKSIKEADVYRPSEEIKIAGVVRKGDKPIWLVNNDPERNMWLWIDLPIMVKQVREKNSSHVVRPVLIQATGEEGMEDEEYPKSLSAEFTVINDHLQYAITWFSLAFILLVMYIVYIRKELKNS